jgi:hypothetical protein
LYANGIHIYLTLLNLRLSMQLITITFFSDVTPCVLADITTLRINVLPPSLGPTTTNQGVSDSSNTEVPIYELYSAIYKKKVTIFYMHFSYPYI